MPDFTLTSTAFEPGGAIPKRYTCDGEDGSPELEWAGAPDDTSALVLLVDDPDARGWVHWIVLDMAGTSTGALARGVGVSPDAPAQGRNDFGRFGWITVRLDRVDESMLETLLADAWRLTAPKRLTR